MHDPEFEKQVQQKMEELQFSPSADVWKKVEGEMKKEKKRRLPLLWIFLLSGLLLGAGYWLVVGSDKKIYTKAKIAGDEKLKIKNEKKENSKEDIAKNDIKTETSDISKKNTDNDVAIKKLTDVDKENSKKNNASINSISDSHLKIGVNVNAQKRSVLVTSKSVPFKTKNEKEKNNEADNNISVLDNHKNTSVQTDNNMVSNDEKEIGKNETTNQQIINSTDSSNKNNDEAVETKKKIEDSSVALKSVFKTPVSKKSKSIKLGFTAGLGSSGIDNTLGSTYYASSPVSLSGTPVTIHTPSAIQSGISFYAGVFLQRSLSSNVSLSARLNYHYYSTKITTGNPGDTVAYVYSSNNYNLTNATPSSIAQGSYYTSGSSRTYINHYHFIELPLLMNLQLNSSKKLPISWQAGLSLSYLIGAGALQYDKISGVYYNNNSLFNKLQLNAITGFAVGFYQKKNLFQIGPEVQYGATDLLNNQANTKQHVFYAGLKFSFIPQKK